MHYIWVTNVEYDALFREGGDDLLSFFAILRHHKRNKSVYYKVKGKGVKQTLKHYTGISINTIKRHLPTLIELGMVIVHSNGNIQVNSRGMNHKILPPLKRRKLIPIIIGKNYAATKISTAYIRLVTNLKSQQSKIDKKITQIKLLKGAEYGRWSKSIRNLVKNGKTCEGIKNEMCKNIVLSNKGFTRLRETGKESGRYFKKKLKEKGLIETKRNIRVLLDGKFSKRDFEYIKQSHRLSEGAMFLGKDSRVHIETASTITLTTYPALLPKGGDKKS